MIVPDRAWTRLPYFDLFSFSFNLANFGVTQWAVVRTNSIFDPNFTGTGHQPGGHDQLNNFYSQYRVYGMSYKLQATYSDNNSVGSKDMSFIIMVTHGDSGIGAGQAGALMETEAYRHWRDVPSGRIGRLGGRVSPARILGMSKEQYRTNPDTSAAFGSNPNTQAFTGFGINLRINPDPQSVGITGTVTVTFYLSYMVELFNRQQLSVS